MVRKNHKWFQNCYFRCPFRELHNSLVSDPNYGGLKEAGMKKIVSLLLIINDGCCCHRNKKIQHDTRSCVVVDVAFMIKLYTHHCYPGVTGI